MKILTEVKNTRSSAIEDILKFLNELENILSKQGILWSRGAHFPTAICNANSKMSPEIQRSEQYPQRIDRVLLFIEENLSQSLNLDILAGEAGLSKFYFAHRFRQEVGLSPWAYVRQRRIRKAKDLLEEGLTPAEAALETGFFDQAHFTRTMKELEGETPGNYQSERKEDKDKNLQA